MPDDTFSRSRIAATDTAALITQTIEAACRGEPATKLSDTDLGARIEKKIGMYEAVDKGSFDIAVSLGRDFAEMKRRVDKWGKWVEAHYDKTKRYADLLIEAADLYDTVQDFDREQLHDMGIRKALDILKYERDKQKKEQNRTAADNLIEDEQGMLGGLAAIRNHTANITDRLKTAKNIRAWCKDAEISEDMLAGYAKPPGHKFGKKEGRNFAAYLPTEPSA